MATTSPSLKCITKFDPNRYSYKGMSHFISESGYIKIMKHGSVTQLYNGSAVYSQSTYW